MRVQSSCSQSVSQSSCGASGPRETICILIGPQKSFRVFMSNSCGEPGAHHSALLDRGVSMHNVAPLAIG